MRIPDQAVLSRPHLLRRYQLAILLAVLGLVIAFVVVQLLADAYTNYLWFGSLHLSRIWRSVAETKAGLALVFVGGFFVACWLSLLAADALAPIDIYSAPEYDLARRYRASIGRFPLATRTVVSFLLALAVGLGASGQWQHWLLFLNGGTFGAKDPQFHRDIGFFVFRLPFLSFLVDWTLVALVLLLAVTAAAHYLNGSLRSSGPTPRADARATAHLSFILAFIALVRAAGYVFVDRFDLDLSSNGIVVGAGYTDVHVRLPAISILAAASMIAFVLCTYNVYYRSWALPAVAVGLWAFVAVVVGMIYPAVVQWVKVNPSQVTVERPYIERNIASTRAAYGLGRIGTVPFAASSSLSPSTVEANASALSELPLWDPTVAGASYGVLQSLRAYYHLSGLTTDRYLLSGPTGPTMTPVVVGTREVNDSSLPRHTWVAEHLEYTHGYGVVLSPANAVSSAGRPLFDISGLPGRSSNGAPVVRQPSIYFGNTPSSGYVVADSKMGEIDYPTSRGTRTTRYRGGGGVQLSGFWQRAAFAMRFHDLNLVDSGLITRRSRILFVQNVRQRVAKAAPFLKVDTNPYPVIAGGRVYWLVDCYTTSDTYPYSEGAATGVLGPASGLQGDYNYVRNSVVAVVDAYSGRVRLFTLQRGDPVLRAWEKIYPGLFQPLGQMGRMSPQLVHHLRYPQALLRVLSAMYGRYHYPPTSSGVSEFYKFDNSWALAQGNRRAPFVPTYELLRLPGHTSSQFVAVEPVVPFSPTGHNQQLAGFLAADSDQPGYGHITAFELSKPKPAAPGPALVATRLKLEKAVQRQVAMLRQTRDRVLYGPPILVPIDDSLVYVQAIYVSPDNRAFPVLEDVAVEIGANDARFAPSLEGALKDVFGPQVRGVGSQLGQQVSAKIASDLDLAYAAYERSLADGKHFRLGALQKALAEMGRYLRAAHRLLAKAETTPNGSRAPSSGSSTGPGSGTTSGPRTSQSSNHALSTRVFRPSPDQKRAA